MAETERVRERERPPLADNPYERIMRQRRDLAERNLTGPVVIRAEDRHMSLTGVPRTRIEAITRRLLGVGIRVPGPCPGNDQVPPRSDLP